MTDQESSYERGPYAKGRERREAIIRTTLEVFSHLGYRGTSLRGIANEVGISAALLQYYFPTREELLTSVIQAWDAENRERSEGMDFLEHLAGSIRNNSLIPGLVHLYTVFAVEASDPGHSARPYFEKRYATLTAQLAASLEDRRAAGLAPRDLDCDRTARLLIAACEGLQVRWLHSPDFDMYDEFIALLVGLGITPPAQKGLEGPPDSSQ